MTSDRSTLEGKDRAELTVIAEAMGNKVGSRMRKAQIIDLIIGSADDGDADKSDADNGDAGKSDADKGDADKGDAGKSDADKGDADKGDAGKSDADKGDADKGDAGKSDGDKESSDKGQRSQNGNQGNQNNQNSQNDDGNKRRRRRRGRDREELPWDGDPVQVDGFLDLRSDGYGFLRVDGGMPSRDDCYVPVKMVRDYGLRSGDRIRGTSRPAARNEKNPALLTIEAINERDPDEAKSRPDFDAMTPVFPDEKLALERSAEDLTARVIDLVAPIGKGQRGLIAAPPKTGTTTVLKEIVRSIETNNPEVRLIVLLVDERPEEVTEMERWMKNGEVVASTFDRPGDEHIAVAELVSERARRMVESGDDVCIVMDGITRLARAYCQSGRYNGRPVADGVDAGALYPVKRFFGSARNIEDGGSLTILATAVVESGSRIDQVIFEEFVGTANMELRLSRDAAERRVWPAVDVVASSTLRDELLLDEEALDAAATMRRALDARDGDDASPTVTSLERLVEHLGEHDTNAGFLAAVAKSK